MLANIAKDIGVDSANVRKSVARLITSNAITKDKKYGRVQTYKISATMAWRGKTDGHKQAIQQQSIERRTERGPVTLEVVK